LIPVQQNNEQDRRIVVGVDGSEHAKAAMRWALTQARLTGATVEAVTAWQDPAMSGFSYGWSPMLFDGDSIATLTEKTLNETIAEVTGGRTNGQRVEITTRVVQGHPAEVMVEVSTGARLLVLGSRGHSTFAGILLGSVSQHCVQHAPCPVVVIPR
jgi:nucleotide-binding universal stress UspA family protein